MADHVDITLWIDRRWKDAVEKHLKGETLQEHLENVLDELCNQLPEQEYKRISAEIYAEDAARRTEEEAARTYAAYHVVENGQEWYFKTSPGEELLKCLYESEVPEPVREYLASRTAPAARPRRPARPAKPQPREEPPSAVTSPDVPERVGG